MRIAHLIWGLKIGGAEAMLIDIASEQAKTCDVTLVLGNSIYDENILSELSGNVQLQCLGRSPASLNPWYGLKLNLLLKRLKPDIIHAHHESFIRLVRFLQAPKVLTVHDTNSALKADVRSYDKVFSISEAVRVDLLERPPHCQSTVVHNGVRFSAIKQKTQYGQHPFRIVQVGRIYHQKKGQDTLLRALAHVNRIAKSGSATVDFIGAGAGEAANESRKFLEQMARELGVEAWCRFLGERSRKEIYQDLANYDLLVQPSRYEGFGLTVIEAMAARLPVLVSDIEGPMEIIDNGRYGYYFRGESFQDCAEKIIEIMALPKTTEFAQKMDENMDYAKRKFDIKVTAKRYLEEYKTLI
jgi:glycosyltransferase involved in cell wall biosynthesis